MSQSNLKLLQVQAQWQAMTKTVPLVKLIVLIMSNHFSWTWSLKSLHPDLSKLHEGYIIIYYQNKLGHNYAEYVYYILFVICLKWKTWKSDVSSNPAHGEVYAIQEYVIKFVRDLRQVGGFLRVLRFPLPIKLTAKI